MKKGDNMKRKFIPILWFLLFVIFVFFTYQVVQEKALWIDSFFIDYVVLHGRNDALTVFFKFVTFFSSVTMILLLAFFFVLTIKRSTEKKYFLFHLGGAIAISQGLKFLFQRERPLLIYRLVTENGYSFPSGHSMVGSSIYIYLIYLLWKTDRSKKQKIISSIAISFLIVGICFSRIYLGVHYASDVIAGLCLGICYTTLFIIWKEVGEKMERKSLLKSFYHAGQGIFSAFLSERNMKIHVGIMFLVIFSGFYFNISLQEWMICLLLFGVVISAEIMNTAVETVVDLAMPKIHPKAKLAKDLSAGAVLVLAFISAVIGIMIFLPKIITFLS